MSKERHEIVNLPNSITLVRIAVIPVLFVLLSDPGPTLSLIIAALFVLAALTDLIDGYIARRYEIVTKTGKLLDPIADKMIVCTAMILLIPIDRAPAWIVAIIIMRDFIVDGIRQIASTSGLVISASKLAKQKTVSQIAAVTALIIHYPLFGANAHSVGTVILYFSLLLTIWSCVEYLILFNRKVIK
jgi:CDP-diacylglycerol--glycerol-3-phosphate 3-phosphatidyltransferase